MGGDAHRMRQRFPRVVLRDMATFEGFLDGYCDGDGHRLGRWDARVVAHGAKPYTVYAYRLDPYPTFLVNGHLVSSPS
ncbi:hypothetical protein [Streptomyces niger]|uniref:hypothetical protein n=1 Tax=Streptomyces niger TaxID=66373 RepID=UPI00069B4008|nr:hypothetical protein [Streptomyces niger]